MMRFAIIGVSLLGACATVNNLDSQDLVLFRGEIESFGEIRELPSQGDEVIMGVQARARLDVTERLIGRLNSSHPYVDLIMTSIPQAGRLRDIYVLGRRREDGSIQALRWDYHSSGLCIPRDEAVANSIEDDIMTLRRAGRIEWDPDCGW